MGLLEAHGGIRLRRPEADKTGGKVLLSWEEFAMSARGIDLIPTRP
jgi:hypothetical protein